MSEHQRTALQITLSFLGFGAGWITIFHLFLPHFLGLQINPLLSALIFILLTAGFIYRMTLTPLLKNAQIARALRHNEQKYRTLVEEINEVIFVLDQMGRITYISPAVTQLTGYQPREMVGRLFLEFIAPEDEEVIFNSFKERISGLVRPMQYRILRKDGTYCWVRSLSKPFKNDRGEIGIRGVLMDITDMIEKDQALMESEARWRSLVEQAPDYIVTTDLQGKIQFVNRNFFSVPEKHILGQMIYDLVPQSEMKKVHQAIREVNEKKTLYRFEIELPIDEQKRWYLIRVGPIQKNNRMVGLTFIATDITRHKLYEGELQEIRSHLQNLVSERTQKLKDANLEIDHLQHGLQALVQDLKALQAQVNNQPKVAETVQNLSQKLHQLLEHIEPPRKNRKANKTPRKKSGSNGA